MFDQFLATGFFPFTLSVALFLGLFLLELVLSLVGGSLMGLEAPGVDTPDLDLPDAGFDAPDLDAPDPGEVGPAHPDAAPQGIVGQLGLGRMPAAIWLASMLIGFGLSGLAIQSAATATLGQVLPAWLAALPALMSGLWLTRRFGTLFARLLPGTETQAISERQMGRRTGIVTQGTAARGRPAEVRITDGYGNTHYLRAEPMRDTLEIAQGTKVLVVRDHRNKCFRLVPLDE